MKQAGTYFLLLYFATVHHDAGGTEKLPGFGARLNTLRAPSVSTCHRRTVLSRLADSRNRLLLQDRSKMSSSWPQNSLTGCGWNGRLASLHVEPSDLRSLTREASVAKPGGWSAARRLLSCASRGRAVMLIAPKYKRGWYGAHQSHRIRS